MSKKILVYFAALIITGSYYSVTIASDSSGSGSFEDHALSTSPEDKNNGFCNMKSMKYVEHSNTESKILDDCKSNNNNIVDYDEETMWFDYQALFDKTKNIMLGKSDTTEVRHIDFEKDDLARKTLLLDGYYDKELVNSAINGNIASQYIMMDNCTNYLFGEYRAYSDISLSSEQEHIIDLNYRYLVGIIASLAGSQLNDVVSDYRHLARFSNSDYLDSINTKTANLCNVMDLII